ncbi:MAG: ribonucleoside-triphosphate reductase [Candidatus Vogelbacteria bacterium RIFOXYD1_FULL_44_32]|uniref:Ribonucleoside-triphosphate reductase n=1 Tax=Candidatus Vogelbacteria bacterium RIFOXYD1_FULL_44_32 TaxID=1802438 RepID=A0A1G2QD39_9BACT|nr:MAG: ribonucleoside-triphosphate reductase [Candidatus Vogelbacteria bacterium RIFOXYD1_FULL_44_32]
MSPESLHLVGIMKRNGTILPFDAVKIQNAIWKAMKATGEGDEQAAEKVTATVLAELAKNQAKVSGKDYLPGVEEIQDLVEKALILEQFPVVAKAYILYRERRSEARREHGDIPDKVKDFVDRSKQYFKNPLGEFVYYRTYANWIEDEGRRETWIETVERYISFMQENMGALLTEAEYDEIRQTILKQEAMPSMRLMQFAGKAARATNVCAYNCSYIAPTKLEDFAEIMYVSMCGTGAGYAAESQNIQQLPIIKRQTGEKIATHTVEDSKEGWCNALTLGFKTWYDGKDVDFDFSQLRPAGARLKTMGGKSSGPEPLRQLLTFTRDHILRKQGKRLSNLDAHDIICKIGEIVVAGGVRRSALISLSDFDDTDIRDAKKGLFWITDPQRSLANNSAVYNEKPTASDFLAEWTALVKSGTGERGIFNRGGLKTSMPERRRKISANHFDKFGTNPCGEIILRSKQFCNLSEVVARAEDTEETLLKKIRIATILGTYQSTLTKFRYLSDEWRQNCEEERLLGVSITGQWDCPAVRNAETLRKMRDYAIEVNKEYAKRFGVNESTSITCVKPSGTVSQTVDAASGMHPRHAAYYIRRIRISATDSLFKMLKDQGVPYNPEVGQSLEGATTYVLDFPVKAPDNSTFKDDLSALEQLKYWQMLKENYTEHNPSVTISVGENEWIVVANWLYENWEMIGGLSFLPRSEHVYQLAPYEEIDEARYQELVKGFADMDFSKIMSYELKDETEVKKELACAGGTCEIEIPVDMSATSSQSA